MALRLQSSTELVTTYGIVMFLVALAIIIVVVLVSAPPAVIPKSCSIYGGLECADIAYGANPTGGSMLLVRASFAVPGTLNVSTFNAVIGGVKSTSGFCSTNGVVSGKTTISEGSSILCIAYFPLTATTSPYTGTFNVSANYCTGASSNNCPGTHNYVFAGSWSTQGAGPITANYIKRIALNASTTTTAKVGTHFIPITITNGQSSATSSLFQQIVYFNPSSYSAYEASNLGNIRFYQGKTAIPSWCESGCNTTGSNAVFWVQLGTAIPATSSIIINMTFPANSLNYDGSVAGECPQCSITGTSSTYILPTNTLVSGDSETTSPTSVYQSGWNSGTSSQGYGSIDVYSADDGGAPLYLCAGAIDSEGGGSYMEGDSWSSDQGGSYTSIGQNGANSDCNMWYDDYGSDQGSESIIGVTSATPAQSTGTTNYGYPASVEFQPSSPSELVVIMFACGNDDGYDAGAYNPCNFNIINESTGSTPGLACSQVNYEYGQDNAQTGIWVCSQLDPGSLYQAIATPNSGEVAVEVYQFPQAGYISTTPPAASKYVCAGAAGGSGAYFNTGFSPDINTATAAVGSTNVDQCWGDFTGSGAAVAGIGVSGWNHLQQTTTSTGTLNFNVINPSSLLIVGIASPASSTPAITKPSWCSLAQKYNYDTSESAMIYVCSNPPTGANVFTAPSGTVMAAYVFTTDPILAPIGYAKYDNGASVFNFYDNFPGTTLDSLWRTPVVGLGNYSVSNSLTLTGGTGAIVASTNTYPPGIAESYVTSIVSAAASPVVGYETTPPASGCTGDGYYSCSGYSTRNQPSFLLCVVYTNGNQACWTIASSTSYGAGKIYGFGWPSTGSESSYVNYAQIGATQANTLLPYANSYISLGVYGGHTTFQWVRSRASPPGGVMPSISLGSFT